MDLSCIILSGDLELYVLGMLSEDEAYKITQLALLFDEVDSEINRIRETLQILSLEAEVEPAAHVRENFLNSIKALAEQEKNSGVFKEKNEVVANTTTSDPDITNEPAKIVSFDSKRNKNQFLLAASVIALIVSIVAIIYLFNKNDRYQQQVASVQQKMQSIDDNNQKQQQLLNHYEHAIAVAQDPATLKILLQQVPGKPDATAQVYWNKNTHEVMVSNVSLPPVPQGKQYQLWAIVNGKPVDAGLLDNNNKPMQKMKDFDQAQAFAITMEKEGGSPTPTMDAMLVIAKFS